MTSLHFGNSCVFWLLSRLKTRTSHVSICVFHCGPAGREVEIFVEALSYRGPPLVGDVLHTWAKDHPLTPRRILAERLQNLEGCWYGGMFRCL